MNTYAPSDRFALTPAGAEYLDALTTPAPAVEDCRAELGEDDPPCGRCEACRVLYGDGGADAPADDLDVIPFP